MASLTLNIKTDKRSAKQTTAGVRYERTYIAVCDTVLDPGQIRLLLETATPETLTYGQAYPYDADALLTEIEVETKDESKLVWEVKAQFETPSVGGSTPSNPLDRDPEIRWGAEYETRAFFIDFAEPEFNFMTNSAGERFPELPQREFGELVISYTRNEAAPDFETMRLANLCVNKFAFTIDGQVIPPRYALLKIPEAPKFTEGAVTYYRVTYLMRFREGGWLPERYLDVGYHETAIVTGPQGPEIKWVPIKDADGMPVRTPYPLDGTGLKKPKPTDPPALLERYPYREIDFDVFDFE